MRTRLACFQRSRQERETDNFEIFKQQDDRLKLTALVSLDLVHTAAMQCVRCNGLLSSYNPCQEVCTPPIEKKIIRGTKKREHYDLRGSYKRETGFILNKKCRVSGGDCTNHQITVNNICDESSDADLYLQRTNYQ